MLFERAWQVVGAPGSTRRLGGEWLRRARPDGLGRRRWAAGAGRQRPLEESDSEVAELGALGRTFQSGEPEGFAAG